jgi:restriction endonuclease S subunit
MTNFEWVEFGNIFRLEKGKLQSSKIEEVEDGDGVFINWSLYDKYKRINKYSLDGENLFISTVMPNGKNGGYMVIKYYNGKCDYGDLMSRLVINDKYENKVSIKYIYYYFNSIKEHIETVYEKGSCNKSLDQNNFNRMKIPIPSLDEQSKIIQNITTLENSTKNLKIAIEANQMNRKMYMEAMIKGATNKGINKVMKLGQVVEHLSNGKRKSSEGSENGKYPLYYCSINNILYMDEYDFDDEAITMNITNGSGKCNLFHAKGKYSVAETTLHFKSKDEKVIKTNILYNYLLLVKDSICKIYKGTQQMSINKDDFNNKIMILIPPLDYQNKMEQTLSNLDKLDEELNTMMQNMNDNIKTAFLNSLDDYGNPNGFNIDKLIDLDTNEEIKEVPKKKTKSKSAII